MTETFSGVHFIANHLLDDFYFQKMTGGFTTKKQFIVNIDKKCTVCIAWLKSNTFYVVVESCKQLLGHIGGAQQLPAFWTVFYGN